MVPMLCPMRLNSPALDALCASQRVGNSELGRNIGRSRQFVGRLRRGERGASAGTIQGIAEFLKVPLAAITVPDDGASR
jgi:transcriptional regulator with XRE-family HTH domain